LKTLLLFAIGLALPLYASDEPEKWTLEVSRLRGKVTDVNWVSGDQKKAALSEELLSVVRKDPNALRLAKQRGVEHGLVIVAESVITDPNSPISSDGAVVLLIAGETMGKPTIPFVPQTTYLHTQGFFYTYLNNDTNRVEIAFFDKTKNESQVLKDDINPVHLKSSKVSISYSEAGVILTEGDQETVLTLSGVKGKPQAKLKEVTPHTQQMLEAMKAEELTAEDADLFVADWLTSHAEKVEEAIVAQNGGKRNSLVVGKGKQTAFVNLIARRIAEGKAKALQGWKVYRVNAALFGPDGFVGTEVKKVNDWFEAFSDQKLILVMENMEKLMLLGGDASTVDKKVTGAMAPYLTSGRVLVIGTASTEGLTRLQQDQEFVSNFQVVNIPQPNRADLKNLLYDRAKAIEARPGKVEITPGAITTLSIHSYRHLPDESEPDIEIEAMEELALIAAKAGKNVVGDDEARTWIAERSRRPSLADDKLVKFSDEKEFYQSPIKAVIGHRHTTETLRSLFSQIANEDRDNEYLDTKYQGLRIVMLLGPSGVGKTFVVSKLAEGLAEKGIKWPINVFDGNEYKSERSDWKMFGSIAGYKDSEKPFLYAWAKENPEGIIFFDEYDKMHPNVTEAMMRVLDDGVIPHGATNDKFRWRGIIFLAANFGARGKYQGSQETDDLGVAADEKELSDLIDQFTLYFTDDYTFTKPNMEKVKKFFSGPDGKIWPKPTNEKEKQVLLDKLTNVVTVEYGKVGRVINNQLLRRVGVIEMMSHFTKREYQDLIRYQLQSRIDKVKADVNADLSFTPALESYLFTQTWGEGGVLVFTRGAGAFVDSKLWKATVKDTISNFAKKTENAGKKWVMDIVKGEVTLTASSKETKQ